MLSVGVEHELSMSTHRKITKKLARDYRKVDKQTKGATLDSLVTTTGWTRDSATP